MRIRHIAAVLACSLLLTPMDTVHAGVKEAGQAVEQAQEKLEKDRGRKQESKKRLEEVKQEVADLSEYLDRLGDEWLAMDRKREEQYKQMKLRIRYMYENSGEGMIPLFLRTGNIARALNHAGEATKVMEYDRDRLSEYEQTVKSLKEKQNAIAGNIKKMESLQKEQETLVQKLSETVKGDKKALSTAKRKLKEEKRKEEEEQRKEEERKAAQAASGIPTSITLSYSGIYNTGAYRLTKRNGTVCYNGHRETYYSQRVLAGGGLSIPGRHVADDGTIRDQDGYICVAAALSFMPRYSTLMTSLGPAKVYDCGCAYGTIDIYVDW